MTEPTDAPAYFSPPPRQRPYGAPYDPAPRAPAGQPALSSPTDQPAGPQLAGPGRRLLARVIDGVIVGLIGSPATVPLFLRYYRHLTDTVDAAAAATRAGRPTTPTVYDGATVRLLAAIGVISLVVSFGYEVPQLARWGQTIGKRICRVRVVRRDGRRGVGTATAAVRWLVSGAAPSVPWVGGLFGILDGLWLLWDRPWRQCLHDKAAATIVVRVPR